MDIPFDEYGIPDYEKAKEIYDKIHCLTRKGVIISAYALGAGGLIEAISKMSFGNRYGVKIVDDLPLEELNKKRYGSLLLELETSHIADVGSEYCTYIGQVNEDELHHCGRCGDLL